MSSSFSNKNSIAESNLKKIDEFIAEINRSELFPKNILAETHHRSISIAELFQKNFTTYRKFGQVDLTRELIQKLFECIDSCDEFTTQLQIHLLLATSEHITWLDQITPGTKKRVRDGLRSAYGGKLFEIEMSFWLLALINSNKKENPHRSLLEYLRDLAETPEERSSIDVAIAKTAELAATFCIVRGVNMDTAQMWYKQAAFIAQTRLNDHSYASQLLRSASSVSQIAVHRTYSNPDFAQAIQSEPGSKEYANAMRKLSVAENLTVSLNKDLEANPSASFLASPSDIEKEYKEVNSKLATLAKDPRFVLNRTIIETQIALDKNSGTGLMEWFGVGQFTDSNWNPRGSFSRTENFICQYIVEVVNIVSHLMETWITHQLIDPSKISLRLASALPNYDTQIFEHGINSFCNRDFISSTHSLITQFENILREWLKKVGADTKKFNRQNIPSEMLLSDFLNSNNTQVQNLLGEDFFATLRWYLVNDGPFDYRNKLAHGWLSASECSSPYISAMIIFFTLKLLSLDSGSADSVNNPSN